MAHFARRESGRLGRAAFGLALGSNVVSNRSEVVPNRDLAEVVGDAELGFTSVVPCLDFANQAPKRYSLEREPAPHAVARHFHGGHVSFSRSTQQRRTRAGASVPLCPNRRRQVKAELARSQVVHAPTIAPASITQGNSLAMVLSLTRILRGHGSPASAFSSCSISARRRWTVSA